jgi:hypothetical protein
MLPTIRSKLPNRNRSEARTRPSETFRGILHPGGENRFPRQAQISNYAATPSVQNRGGRLEERQEEIDEGIHRRSPFCGSRFKAGSLVGADFTKRSDQSVYRPQLCGSI